ncbi:hypothetical protein D3C87_1483250 [compost metagenome]
MLSELGPVVQLADPSAGADRVVRHLSRLARRCRDSPDVRRPAGFSHAHGPPGVSGASRWCSRDDRRGGIARPGPDYRWQPGTRACERLLHCPDNFRARPASIDTGATGSIWPGAQCHHLRNRTASHRHCQRHGLWPGRCRVGRHYRSCADTRPSITRRTSRRQWRAV